MKLCIDVGNSHIYGGVFVEGKIDIRFRHASKECTADELGIFFKNVLRENNCSSDAIADIGICSVVPQLDHALKTACRKYFSIDPFFLHAEVNTGLTIKYHNPSDVGADRIANAIAASHLYPNQNLIIIDFGTATTFCTVTAGKHYLGGAILPGFRLAMEALSSNTAKLPAVDIIKANQVIGRSTIESIQSGLFYGALGSCKELIARIKSNDAVGQDALVLATGGFAHLFEHEDLFQHLVPDLVLQGIYLAINTNSYR
ncbi:MAG: type III pantothenate kinase [Legionella sp.]